MDDFRNNPYGTPLSPEGKRRRREILQVAIHEARAIRSRRFRRRIAIVGAIALLAVLFIPRPAPRPLVHQSTPAPEPRHVALATRIVPRVTPRPPRQPSEILITYIQTDPQIASHLTLSPQKPTWQTIGDDALLERLSEAGKPAGLAYVDGRAIILFRNKAPPSNAVPHQFR
jgi:hypothetical protein